MNGSETDLQTRFSQQTKIQQHNEQNYQWAEQPRGKLKLLH